ncbi:O46/O134 family O-antigen polymerase, partial [Escherichia coli]|nr:O46/O134 family O-antigen polymerase [Escherichia coli]
CMLILSNGIYWRDIIRYLSLAHFLVILFIIPLVFFAEKYSFIDDRFGVRYTFGFHNPNTFSQYLISLYVVFLLLFVEVIKKKSLQFLTVIILTLFIYGVISLTGSRTGMILTIITGFGFLACTLSKTNDKKRRKFVYLYILGAGILCFIQYYLALTYNHSEFSKNINTILSGRIWFSSQLTSQLWPVPYFHGVNINDYLPIDFFYVAY